MSTSLAQKCATFQIQRLLNRPNLSGVSVVDDDLDTSPDSERITVQAERGVEDPEGSGIYSVTLTIIPHVVTSPAATLDAWLAEIDATMTDWTPGVPTAGYIAAAAALSVFIIINDQSTDEQNAQHTFKQSREFLVKAKEA